VFGDAQRHVVLVDEGKGEGEVRRRQRFRDPGPHAVRQAQPAVAGRDLDPGVAQPARLPDQAAGPGLFAATRGRQRRQFGVRERRHVPQQRARVLAQFRVALVQRGIHRAAPATAPPVRITPAARSAARLSSP
jgi:hypothetical protein